MGQQTIKRKRHCILVKLFLLLFSIAPTAVNSNNTLVAPLNSKALLINAIHDGEHQKIEDILKVSPELANACEFEASECIPLVIVAIEFDDTVAARILLENGAKPDGYSKQNTNTASPLMMATYVGNREASQLLLQFGADLSLVTKEMTALHAASYLGRIWFVAEFLRHGADPNFKLNEMSAKDYALKGGHPYLAGRLESPKQWMQSLDHAMLEAIKISDYWQVQSLIAQGAQVDLVYQDRPLISHAINNQAYDIAEALKNSGADLEQQFQTYKTPIIDAISNENDEGVEWLIEKGVSLDSPTSPLVIAIGLEQTEIANLLIQKGANINNGGESAITPLEIAIATLNKSVVLNLISRDADLNVDTDVIDHFVESIGGDVAKVSALLSEIIQSLKRNTNLLLNAAQNGDQESWEKALGSGVIIDARDEDNFTALHRASYKGDALLVSALLKYNPSLTMEVEGYTALMLAVLSGSLESVHYLLQSNADPEQVSGLNKSALVLSDEQNNRGMSKLLREPEQFDKIKVSMQLWDAVLNNNQVDFQQYLSLGADVEWRNSDGFTPLHIATRDGRLEMVKTLIEYGANVNVTTDNRWTPLLLAAKNSRTDVLITLLDHAASINNISEENKIALDYVKASRLPFTEKFLSTEKVQPQLLLDYKLIDAAQKSDTTKIYNVLNQGADANQKDDNGWRAIDYAVRNGHMRSIMLLLDADSSIEHFIVTQEGDKTPLMLASYNGYLDVVYELLSRGADQHRVNSQQQSALILARKNKKKDVVSLLEESHELREQTYLHLKANQNLLYFVSERVSAATPKFKSYALMKIKALLKQGADPNYSNDINWYSLQIAARGGDLPVTKLLLEYGADPEAIVISDEGPRSALDLAVYNNQLELVELLRTKTNTQSLLDQAIVVARNRNLKEIEDLLVSPGQYETLVSNREFFATVKEIRDSKSRDQVLVDRVNSLLNTETIDLSREDFSGMRAVDYVLLSEFNYVEILQRLLPETPYHHQFFNKRSGIYYTPLMLAVEGGNLDQINYLLQRGYLPNEKSNSDTSAIVWVQMKLEKVEALLADADGVMYKFRRLLVKHRTSLDSLDLGAGWARFKNISNVQNLLLADPASRAKVMRGVALLGSMQSGDGIEVTRLLNEGNVEVNLHANPLYWAKTRFSSGNVETSPLFRAPLHYAVIEGNSEWVSKLIKNGADINIRDWQGLTPLMLAVLYSRSSIFDLLVAAKADIDLKDNNNRLAKDIAIIENQLQLYIALSALTKEIQQEDLAHWNELAELQYAVEVGHLELTRSKLAQLSPKVVQLKHPLKGPLHIAAEKGELHIIEALLNAGFDPNQRDHMGATPLMLAAKNSLASVSLLQAHGALATLIDNSGQSAEDYAERFQIDDKKRAEILNKLWLPEIGNTHLAVDMLSESIKRHYPISEIDTKLTSEQWIELTITAVEYSNVDALKRILSINVERVSDQQIFSLLRQAVATENRNKEVVNILLTEFADRLHDSEYIIAQVNELAKRDPKVFTSLLFDPLFEPARTSEHFSILDHHGFSSDDISYFECQNLRSYSFNPGDKYIDLVSKVKEQCDTYFSSTQNHEAKLVLAVGHQSHITFLAKQANAATNGNLIASGDLSGTVIVWENESKKELNKISLTGGKIQYLEFVSGKPWLIAATKDVFLVWDIQQQQILWKHEVEHQNVWTDQKLLWVSKGNELFSYDLKSGEQKRRWLTSSKINKVGGIDQLLYTYSGSALSLWSTKGQLLSVIDTGNPIIRLLKISGSSQQLLVQNTLAVGGKKLATINIADENTTSADIGVFPSISFDADNVAVRQGEGTDEWILLFNQDGDIKRINSNDLQPDKNKVITLRRRFDEFKSQPIISATLNSSPTSYLVAQGLDISLINEKGAAQKKWSGYANYQKSLCRLSEDKILFNNPIANSGLDLTDRGLPPVINRDAEDVDWLCNTSREYRYGWNKGILYVYKRTQKKPILTLSEFDPDTTPVILDNESNHQVVVIGHRIRQGPSVSKKNNAVVIANDVIVYDLQTGRIKDEFSAFPILHTYTKTVDGNEVQIAGVRKSKISPNGDWLALSNERELLLYNLSNNVIAKRDYFNDVADIALNDSELFVLNNNLHRYSLETLNSTKPTIKLKLNDNSNLISEQRLTMIASDTVVISNGKTLYRVNLITGESTKLEGEHEDYIFQTIVLANGKLMSVSKDASMGIWDLTDGLQARFVVFDDGNWAALHKSGLFDASKGGMEKLYFRVRDQLLDIEQLKSRYFEPYLLQKVLGFHQESLRETKSLSRIALYPKAKVEEVEHGKFVIHITAQGGGIGETRVYLNGKLISLNSENSQKEEGAESVTWHLDLSQHTYLASGDNSLSVVTYNQEGYLSSRGLNVTFVSSKSPLRKPPKLYIVSIGVSNYHGEDLDLRFAAKDAVDIENALTLGAERLFGTNRTKSWLLSTDLPEANSQPTKKNIQDVFTYLQKHATSDDILVMYLSGHGITLGGQTTEYYFLTKEAYSSDLSAYRDPILLKNSALSSNDIIQLVNSTSVLKQVLILDTCASGQVVDNLAQKRDLSSKAIRALEEIQSRAGMHVITGSTADAVSYEASQFGQGVLTYSLLEGMKGAALEKGSFVDVVKLFSRARDRVPELAKNIGGIQQPVIFSKADSFYIGELNEKDRESISLLQPKPIFLMSTFMNLESFDDNLGLEKQLDEHLQNVSALGRNSPLVYVEAKSYPDGIRIRGTYVQLQSEIKMTVAVFKGDKSLGIREFSFSMNKLENWTEELTQQVLSTITN
ncbi:MAG: ankyrin repeat protein/uncharacterized caspase-like protein [Oleiphilaceae bacterium]|jgi:ankyrin repeat protein/uncharacterized caspase-like protein